MNSKLGVFLHNPYLHRFWIEFKKPLPSLSLGLGLGCGVTAYNYADALKILKEKVFVGLEIWDVESVVVDIDIQTLNQGKIIPNMGLVTERGVWFPGGY